MSFRGVVSRLHLALVAIWLAMVLMSGVVAAVAFPAMHQLEPRLDALGNIEGDHAVIAAGHITAKVFMLNGQLQAVIAPFVFLTLLPCLRQDGRLSRWAITRCVLLGIAAGFLIYHAGFLSPRMARHLDQFYSAAERNDKETAEVARLKFVSDRPMATFVIVGKATFVFLGLVGTLLQPTRSSAGLSSVYRDEEG